MRNVNRIASVMIILFAIWVFTGALKFIYMDKGTPGPGFMPFWISIFLAIAALIPLIKSFSKFASVLPNPFSKGDFKEFFIVTGGAIGAMILTQLVGLLIALGVMAGFQARLLGTKNWKVVAGITVGVPLVLFLIFDTILGVPLPDYPLELGG